VLAALAKLDAAVFSPDLGPANARACWRFALEGAARVDLQREVSGTLPSTVLLIASANVFTAPVEWIWQLTSRGVHVILKAAREHEQVARALAAHFPKVDAREWRGGQDVEAEREALANANAVMVFGSNETITAVQHRAPKNLPFLGFGAKFGIAVVDRLDASTAQELAADLALYDGRGCMSPAAIFAREVDIPAVEAALERAERWLPRGVVHPDEAMHTRRNLLAARSNGDAWFTPIETEKYSAVHLRGEWFAPSAPPRQLVVIRWNKLDDILRSLGQNVNLLGTVGTTADLVDALRTRLLPARAPVEETSMPAIEGGIRFCPIGRMQTPPGDRAHHDGVDVLAALARNGPE
jgi:hypothetical protein